MTASNIKFNKWPIIGNNKVLLALQNNIKNNLVSHAYLFIGPDSVGKSMFANYFAKSLLCNGDIRPCGNCDECRKNDSGPNSELILLDQKEAKIKIDDIRKLQHKLSLKSLNKYKICIINGIDRFTIEAANAILKLLEEPKGNTVFILVANNLENVIATIRSRCVLYRFSLVSEKEMSAWLESFEKNNKIDYLTILASGKPGLAKRMLQEKDLIEEIKDTYKDIFEILSSNLNKGFLIADKWAHYENYKLDKLDLLVNWLRNLFYYKIGAMDKIFQLHKTELFQKHSINFTLTRIEDMIIDIISSKEQIKNNANRKLVLENIVLKLKNEN